MTSALDHLFLWARRRAVLYRFALFTRILLAAGFIPTGLVKALGHRFTLIPADHPIGAFFEAMHQTGLYWRFIGLTQILAGILLLIPRTAHLGAAIFLGIITNIFVITVSLHFAGTPIVTGLMLLAVVFLCMWDYHRFRPLITERPPMTSVTSHRLDPVERAGFALFALSLLAFFLTTRSFAQYIPPVAVMATGALAGLVALARFVQLALTGRLVTLMYN